MRLLARRQSRRLRTPGTTRSHGLQSNLRRRKMTFTCRSIAPAGGTFSVAADAQGSLKNNFGVLAEGLPLTMGFILLFLLLLTMFFVMWCWSQMEKREWRFGIKDLLWLILIVSILLFGFLYIDAD